LSHLECLQREILAPCRGQNFAHDLWVDLTCYRWKYVLICQWNNQAIHSTLLRWATKATYFGYV